MYLSELLASRLLIIVAQSAKSHWKWKEAIERYHDRLFDDEYETERIENGINYNKIITVYLPIYNYWNQKFFGLEWFQIKLDWFLFCKLFSLCLLILLCILLRVISFRGFHSTNISNCISILSGVLLCRFQLSFTIYRNTR